MIFRFFLLLSLSFILHARSGEVLRQWTSADGRTMEAVFVKGTETAVTLKLKGGRQVEVPFSALSAEDAKLGRELVAAAAIDGQRERGLKEGPYAESLTGEWEKMKSADGLQYHFYAGKRLKKDRLYPLCIYLHGASNTGSNLEKREPGANGFAEAAVYGKNPSFIIAPEAPAGTGAFKEIAPRISALIDDLCANLPVDRDRIYVTGYSMGAMGTWALMAAEPDRFAAAAPVGGPLGGTRVESLPAIPLWLHFGEEDRGAEFRALSKQLEAKNPAFKFTEYPGAGHTGFHNAVAKNPEFYEWLFAQKRSAADAQ